MAQIVAVLDDLIFTVKIGDAAKRLGRSIVFVRDEQALARELRARPELVIVDLNTRALPALEVARGLKQDPSLATTAVIGYISHVQTEARAQAVAAGLDAVYARSAFVDQLSRILSTPTVTH